LESSEGGGAGFGAHAAAQDDRVVASGAKGVGDAVEVCGPLGKDQAVSATSQLGLDIPAATPAWNLHVV